MNTSHRSIWNAALGAWVAVSEITAARGKRSGGASLTAVAGSVLALTFLLASAPALAGGDGGYGGLYADVNYPGPNWTAGDSASGAGGHGGNGQAGLFNGGDGGATGTVMTTSGITNTNPIAGGNGVSSSSSSGGGGGGGGGAGVVAATGLANFTNNSAIVGGGGGSGSGSVVGGGGGGGAGVVAATGLANFMNSGTIIGGDGGNGGSSGDAGSGGSGEGGAAGGNRNGTYAQGGAGIIGSNMAITNAGTISGGLSGDGGTRAAAITFTGGSNSLTLQTGSVLAGAIEISSGATASIVAGNTGLSVGNLIVGGNATVDTNGNTLTAAGVISGAGTLAKTGAGTLTLTGANTYSGATTISGGTLALSGNATLSSSSAVNLAAGTTLDMAGHTGGTSIRALGNTAAGQDGTVNLGGNTLTLTNASSTFGGVIQGTGGLRLTGGTQILTGANTYSGTTTVSAGTLRAGALNTFSASSATTVATGATLDLNGFNQTIGSLSGSGNVSLGSGRLTTGGNNTTTIFSGQLSGSLGSLTKNGVGPLTLSGANTYGGGTTLNAGTLTLGSNTALGTGALTVGGASTLGSNTAVTANNNVTLNANLTVDGANNLTLGGTVSGTGGLIKTGAAVLTLSGTNTFTGSTAISGGTLRLGAGSTLATGSSATVASGATLDLNGNNQTLGTLTGTGNVTLGSGNLTLGSAAVNTFGGNISGTGSFTKTGTGTVQLSGTNTHSGATTISSGTLQALSTSSLSASSAVTVNTGASLNVVGANTVGSLAGAGALVLDANLTTGGDSTSTTFSGNISSTGGLTKVGSGTLALTGTNVYTGGTTVTAGTLQGDTNSLRNAITNNSVVVFNQTANGTYAGNMGGTGSLTKTNSGTLVLTGSNSYSGGTSINLGTLQGNSDSLQGAIHNGTAIVFDQATNGSYTGAMDGLGTLTKTGAGTLVLSGTNTYSGGTTVSAGALQGSATSLRGNITNNAAVNFDQATTGTYTGVMGGTGNLTKLGAGNLVLTGINTYNGATSVNAGTLSINGSIANSAVTVNSGGTLGGNGTLGSTTIASGGVLAPGNSIGTLTVNGNLTFATGSIYRVEVDAAGANDRINATGTATINGGTVDVQAGAGTYAANTQYTILNAAGGRTGNFTAVTSNLAFLTPTLGYDANNVFLTLARNDINFSAVAVTPNQIATSTALQNANAGATGDMSTVQTALTGLSVAQARAAYDSTSGAGIVALRRAGAGFATSFGSQLQARLGAQASNGSPFANSFSSQPVLLAANDHLSDLMVPMSDSAPQKFSLAGGASALSSSPSAAGKGLWVRGYGGYGNTDSDGNATSSRLRSSGLSVGFDQEVKEGLRLGAAITSGTSRLSTDNNESGKTRSSAVALYGSYATGPWNFSGSASVSWGKNHMDRNVVVGAINRVASSDFDGNTLAAYGEASYSLPMNGWTLQPLAGLSLSRNKADGFTETGAGALNLQVASQTINSSKSMLGAKASFDTGRIRFEPRVIWAHEFGDLNTPMRAQFQGAATGSPFQVSGAALKRDTLILGLGATGSVGKGMDLFADIQAEHNAQQRNLAVLVGLRSRW